MVADRRVGGGGQNATFLILPLLLLFYLSVSCHALASCLFSEFAFVLSHFFLRWRRRERHKKQTCAKNQKWYVAMSSSFTFLSISFWNF